MKYLIAKEENIEEVIILKNEVVKRLNEINLPLWNEEYPSDELIAEDILKGYGRIIINEENDEIIAYASLMDAFSEFEEDIFKETNLYSFARLMVKNTYLKKKVGSFLVSSLLIEVKKLGIRGVGILVDPRNENAIKLYEKFNFHLDELREFVYGPYLVYTLIF